MPVAAAIRRVVPVMAVSPQSVWSFMTTQASTVPSGDLRPGRWVRCDGVDRAPHGSYAAETHRRDYGVMMSEQGFRAPEAKRIAGITYRQLDYWTRTGLVTPSLNDAHGSGTQRLYSFQDLATFRVI